jgi:DNA-binding beta-propeller fold protein YncE
MIRRTERLGLFFALVMFSFAGVADTIAAEIYWTTAFGGVIERANTDGTGREVIASAGTLPGGIALDPMQEKVYWTGLQGRTIRRSNLDGSGTETLLVPQGNPKGIAVDAVGGKIYWTETVATFRIMRSNLDGSSPEPVITFGVTGAPSNVELDLVNGYMYFPYFPDYPVNNEGGIWRTDLNGQGLTKIIDAEIGAIELELNPLDGRMYWANNNTDNIYRAFLDGTGRETLVTGLSNPLGLALDVSAGHIYWADHIQRVIQRSNFDGSNVETILSDLNDPHHIALLIPEPASSLLLLLGCAWMLHRRTAC